jgi:hypothetical protein
MLGMSEQEVNMRSRVGVVVLMAACGLGVAAPAAAEPSPINPYDRVPGVVSGGPVPTMNGIPCVGGHLGVCVGFAQNQPVPHRPQARIGNGS